MISSLDLKIASIDIRRKHRGDNIRRAQTTERANGTRERLEERPESGEETERGTVAATYVENRVTNHKRVYGGASDHWPQRIIDGYGRCRVSIRRTIEMKGCTRTVKADLVAIPQAEPARTGLLSSPPPSPFHPPSFLSTPTSPFYRTPHVHPARDAIRLPNAIRTDRPSLSVSNHPTPTLSDSLVTSPFSSFSSRSSLERERERVCVPDLWRNP